MRDKKEEQTEITITEVTRGRMILQILGTTPLVLNRMSEKARHQLLLPRPRMNASEKGSSLKHSPLEEFRAAAHQLTDGPTLLAIQAAAFKRALSSAALDMPGAKKAQIGRLTYVEGDYVGIYGVPQLYMAVVRSADMNHTPDIRTRVIVPKWCAQISLTYVTPLLREKPVLNLLAAAGIYIGIGDGRPEKGALNFGQYQIVGRNDAEFAKIVKTGGRKAQIAAMANPTCYDRETSEMLAWYGAEVERRGFDKKHGREVIQPRVRRSVRANGPETEQATA